MNPNKPLLRLLTLTQIFCLLILLSMPVLIRLLSETLGKILYALLAIACVGLILALRYAFKNILD